MLRCGVVWATASVTISSAARLHMRPSYSSGSPNAGCACGLCTRERGPRNETTRSRCSPAETSTPSAASICSTSVSTCPRSTRATRRSRAGDLRVVLATGRYGGEGFADPRLDALFLAMPHAWNGTLVQYAGRLHRLHPGKPEVRVGRGHLFGKNGLVYPRSLQPPAKSFFLFGPRGTGKSSWLRDRLPDAIHLDLLESDLYTPLLASPQRLEGMIPQRYRGWVVLDEVQKVPALLDEVHRLIERRRLRFALTGSSARKLRRRDVNLLAGRALTLRMHPLTAAELGRDFDLRHSLHHGQLPAAYVEENPAAFLKTYVQTYLREEVQQEGLTRNLAAFARFLEAASFSQGSVLNASAVAREANVDRKVVEDYFGILEDLLLAKRVPVFRKRAKRRMIAHPKFYFFDAGVYRAIRPRGPLDTPDEIDGAALETLVLQELRAVNDYADLGYDISYWRTASGVEVDFVLYGERGIVAIEVKRAARLRDEDLSGLEAFRESYPMARTLLLYAGTRAQRERGVEILPVAEVLPRLVDVLSGR